MSDSVYDRCSVYPYDDDDDDDVPIEYNDMQKSTKNFRISGILYVYGLIRCCILMPFLFRNK